MQPASQSRTIYWMPSACKPGPAPVDVAESWHVGRWFWKTSNSHDIIIFALVELRNSGSIITLLSNQYYAFPPWISDFPQALAKSKDVSDVLFTCTFSMPGGLIQPTKIVLSFFSFSLKASSLGALEINQYWIHWLGHSDRTKGTSETRQSIKNIWNFFPPHPEVPPFFLIGIATVNSILAAEWPLFKACIQTKNLVNHHLPKFK